MVITVKTIVTGNWKENCYVVHSTEGDTVVVDPGGEAEAIVRYVEKHGLTAHAILNTHGHYDHVAAVKELQSRLSIPFYLHSKDLRLLKSANLYRKLFDIYEPISVPEVDRFVEEMESPLSFGTVSVETIATPGHTNGSVCFLIEGSLFAGDTLFQGAVGRTDLPGGDPSALAASLRILSLLPPETQVYSGHGEPTEIGRERASNAALVQAMK